MKNEDHFLPYTAGYVDGDGCFSVGITKQFLKGIQVYERSIQILSVRKPVLDFFQEEFGGFIHMKPKKERHKPAYCWTVKNEPSLILAQGIFPFLQDKRKACGFYIFFCDLISRNDFKKVSEEIIHQRNNLIKRIKENRDMEDFVTKELIEGLKGIQNTIDPRPQDFAYLAGLIDAEGCFRVKSWLPKGKPNRVFAISLQIGNTKYPIFPWLMQRFGGSVCYSEATKFKPVAIWSIAAVKLYDLLPSLYPFLRSKKDVCRKLMEFQETVLPDGGDRHSEEFKTRYSKILKTREDIVNEIHKLNAKGE